MNEYIKFDDAIKAMYRLEKEDIETYGCEIPEGFDGERARLALCLLPRYKDGENRPTGHWIEHLDESGKWYECNQCHTDWGGPVNYCPNCGVKM